MTSQPQSGVFGGAGLLGIDSSGGVYGFAVGPGPRSTAPDWDGKAPSPVTPEGVAHYHEVLPRVCAAEPKSFMPKGTLFRADLPFR
jgi:hypothetical protein